MPIQILPDVLVARIAAGEVIERPAAVVKELVENAIDAGAREIRVECAEGGRRLIRITDDGGGILSDEIETAFLHHATSKLSHIDDLQQIQTLGFRGEALASIASVSQVTCVSRHAGEQSGTLIRLDNGKIVAKERNGRPVGTTMTIEHLFSRVPARLKFLKSNQTERGHIDAIMLRYALAYPHIRFVVVHDGKTGLQTNGNGELRDVLIEAYGADVASQMVPFGDGAQPHSGASVIRVRGFAALPAIHHGNRNKITLFVNGRPVQDTKLSYAVIQAYHTLLMTGRFPIAVALVDVPPDEVDVNVHPAKSEVRFRDADAVFSAVQRAVRAALLTNMAPPEPPSVFNRAAAGAFAASDAPPAAGADGDARVASGVIEAAPRQPSLAGSDAWDRVGVSRHATDRPAIPMPTRAAAAVNTPEQLSAPGAVRRLPALRILGQLAATYILAEGPEGLYLIDQHAAHERILFEKMLAQYDAGDIVSQALLDPQTVTVPADTAALLEMHLEGLRTIGFEIDPFGGSTFLVRSVPQLMQQDDIATAVRDIVADLETGDQPLRAEVEAKLLRRVCKRMAIKAGRVLSLPEMQALVRDLEACESPRTCPHGRPTMIQIGVQQLEREFGRLGA
jgi:DNA mismatch repair protein MutL